MPANNQRNNHRRKHSVNNQNSRRVPIKIKKGLPPKRGVRNMSEDESKLLKDNVAFTNSMFQQFSERLTVIENRLNYIEGNRDNKGRSDLDKLIENHQQTLKTHEEWLILVDKAVKEFRVKLNQGLTESHKPSWKFW